MSSTLARWIFYLGVATSLALFLVLTVDTHRQIRALTHADRLTDQVVAGKHVWHRHNCNDCHTILGFGSYYAPDMTKVYWRRGADGIAAVVRQPERHTTWRKMPHVSVSDQEMKDLVAFLEWTSNIDTHDWPPQDQRQRRLAASAGRMGVSRGAALFQAKGCFECHRLEGVGGDSGPDLTHAGGRLSRETIEAILTDAARVTPAAAMPAPDLTPGEREEMSRFLMELR